MWYLDSLDNNCLGVAGWGCVEPANVNFFFFFKVRLTKAKKKQTKKNDGFTNKKKTHTHTHTRTHNEKVQWYIETSEMLETKYNKKLPGIMYVHIPLPEVLSMYNNFNTNGMLEDSGVCCWSVNTGLFAAMLERGDIISVWHGHDHDNDFQGNYPEHD